MGMLKNGKWVDESIVKTKDGKFVRSESPFRNFIHSGNNSPKGSPVSFKNEAEHTNILKTNNTKYIAEAKRYHLYISYACPWANRTSIMRKLKGLEDVISLSVVSPHMGDNGWEFSDFPDTIKDTVNNADYLWEIYAKAKPDYTGKVTVPVLWDKETNTIVNNESREILRILDTEFETLAKNKVSFCPDNLKNEIDKVIDEIYEPINNGVYKAGFSSTQEQYEIAVNELFKQLDIWENVLSYQRYLCGNILTEADICMFTTLYRFDPVYYLHFKCNIKRIVDYPNLWNYLKDIYQYPGVSESCNLQHVKEHYYWSHPFINPHRIIPVGPSINYDEPHDRNKF